MQMLLSGWQHRYVIVFIEHLTKWAEVYPVKDQIALIVAHTLVEKFLPMHGAPRVLLLDQKDNGTDKEVTENLYHFLSPPDQFHCTKTTQNGIKNWPCLMCSSHVEQLSRSLTKVMPLYGQEPRLPENHLLQIVHHQKDTSKRCRNECRMLGT